MAKRDQVTCPESATKSVTEMGNGQSSVVSDDITARSQWLS